MLGVLVLLSLMLGACSAGRPNGLGGGSPGAAKKVVELYKVVAEREDFGFPRARDDYAIDSAMRLGRVPRLDEATGYSSDTLYLDAELGQWAAALKERAGGAEAE